MFRGNSAIFRIIVNLEIDTCVGNCIAFIVNDFDIQFSGFSVIVDNIYLSIIRVSVYHLFRSEIFSEHPCMQQQCA